MTLHPAQLKNLKDMRELLSDPSRWTKKAYARDPGGWSLPSTHQHATCWCILGAQAKTAPSHADRIKLKGGVTFNFAIFEALKNQIGAKGQEGIPYWQDAEARTHADVLALLDRTIAYETKKCGKSKSTV